MALQLLWSHGGYYAWGLAITGELVGKLTSGHFYIKLWHSNIFVHSLCNTTQHISWLVIWLVISRSLNSNNCLTAWLAWYWIINQKICKRHFVNECDVRIGATAWIINSDYPTQNQIHWELTREQRNSVTKYNNRLNYKKFSSFQNSNGIIRSIQE